MRKSVYIETTVVSYFAARASRDLIVAARQQSTRELWPKLLSEYDTYVSALVYQEAARGEMEQADQRLGAIKPLSMLDVDQEAQALAEKIIDDDRRKAQHVLKLPKEQPGGDTTLAPPALVISLPVT